MTAAEQLHDFLNRLFGEPSDWTDYRTLRTLAGQMDQPSRELLSRLSPWARGVFDLFRSQLVVEAAPARSELVEASAP